MSPRESGSMDVATRLVDSLTGRFFFLAGFPYAGRARDEDFGSGSRSFAAGEYVIVYCVEGEDVLILRVVHGRRNLESLFEK
jgi:toxin ParE1/3/4